MPRGVAVLPIARWNGFGGASDFNGEQFEPFTYAAAITAQTEYPSVFSTVHVPSMHPLVVAKQCATIDHVGGGRFTLNIVTGWNTKELALFGARDMEHGERYDVADEWISLIKLLWTSDEPVTFEGKYFKVQDAVARPKPIQPWPALVSAGASDKGRAFAAKHCDIGFTVLLDRDPASIRERVDSYKKLAREQYGREVQAWISAYVFQGDTIAEAERRYDYIVREKGDQVGADNVMAELGIIQKSVPVELLPRMREPYMAGYAGFKLMGTPQMIVDDLAMLSGSGVDGVLLSFPQYRSDMRRFADTVHPLLVAAGLR